MLPNMPHMIFHGVSLALKVQPFSSAGSAGELIGASSILPLAVAQSSTHSPHKTFEDVSQKREHRLMKNRYEAVSLVYFTEVSVEYQKTENDFIFWYYNIMLLVK